MYAVFQSKVKGEIPQSTDVAHEAGSFLFDVPKKPYVRALPKVGRNEPCPCGSGKKYKKCHGKG